MNCYKCGCEVPTWYAENELFNKVNGSPNGILCPLCFQKMADEMGENIIFKAIRISEDNGGTAEAEQQKFMETFKIGDRVLFQSPSSPDEKYRTNGGPH